MGDYFQNLAEESQKENLLKLGALTKQEQEGAITPETFQELSEKQYYKSVADLIAHLPQEKQEDEANKFMSALMLEKYMDIKAIDLYNDWDAASSALNDGTPITPRNFVKAVGQSINSGRLSVDQGLAYYDLLEAKMLNADTAKITNKIQNLESQMVKYKIPLLLKPIIGGTELISQVIANSFETAKTAAPYMATGASIGIMGAAAIGQIGPQIAAPEEAVTIPALGVAGLQFGYRYASGLNMAKVEAGHAYKELSELKDEQGKEIPDSIKIPVSLLVGSFNGIIEMVQITNIPGMGKAATDLIGKILGQTSEETIAKGILNPIIRKMSKKVVELAGKAGISNDLIMNTLKGVAEYGGEILQEDMQELITIMGRQAAVKISNTKTGTELDMMSVDEIADRITQTTLDSAASFLFTMGAGNLIQTGEKKLISAVIRSKQAIDTVATRETEEASQALKEVFGAPEMGIPAQRLETGKIYTRTQTGGTTSEGLTTAKVIAGSPKTGKKYGDGIYIIDNDEIRVTDIRVDPRLKDAEEIRETIIKEIAAQAPGKPINILDADEAVQATVKRLIEENPRGKEFGVQWYDAEADTEVQDFITFKNKMAKVFRNNTPEQIDFIGWEVQRRAAKVGLQADEYVRKFFTSEGFTTTAPQEMEKAVAITDQKTRKIMGTTVFRDSKALIYAAQNADFRTLQHEIVHVFTNEIMETSPEEFASLSKAFGVEGREWKTADYEKLAYSFEHYLATGQAETPEIKSILQKIVDWMKSTYKTLSEMMIVTPEIKKAFDNMFADPTSPINKTAEAVSKGTPIVLFEQTTEEIRDDKGRLLAPNGKPSNLNESQWKQVRTDAFKAWFGDWENDPANASKVIDKNGEPKIVYHGSGTGGIEVFDPSKTGTIQTADWGTGIYLTPSIKSADYYAREAAQKNEDKEGDKLYKEYEELSKKYGTRPMYAFIDLGSKNDPEKKRQYQEIKEVEEKWRDHREEFRKTNEGFIYPLFLNIRNPFTYTYQGITDPWLDRTAKEQGSDGILILSQYDPDNPNQPIQNRIEEIIAFAPEQIKSATANVGTFDVTKPSILFQTERDVQKIEYKFPEALKGYSDIHSQSQISGILSVFGRGVISQDGKDIRIGDVGTSHINLARGLQDSKRFYFGYKRESQTVYIVSKNGIDTDYFKKPAILQGILSQVFDKYRLNVAQGKRLQFQGKETPRVLFQEEIKTYDAEEKTDANPEETKLYKPKEAWIYKSEKVISDKLKGPMPGKQILKMLESAGVKAEELKWMALNEFLDTDEKLKPQDVQEYIVAHKLKIEEKTLEETVKYTKEDITYKGIDKIAGILCHVFEVPGNIIQVPVSTYETKELAEAYVLSKVKIPNQTKYSKYILLGGENYREMLFTLPLELLPPITTLPASMRAIKLQDDTWWIADENGLDVNRDYRGDQVESYETKEAAIEAALESINNGPHKNKYRFKESGYRSPHWEETNVLAHTRVDDRIDSKNRNMLFIEEIQSDWHQAGRKKGYKSKYEIAPIEIKHLTAEDLTVTKTERQWIITQDKEQKIKKEIIVGQGVTPTKEDAIEYALRMINRDIDDENADVATKYNYAKETNLPDAPFSKTWHEFVFKRLIREAAEKGYEAIGWTTGEQQAERYDLSKQIETIGYIKSKKSNTYQISVWSKNGPSIYQKDYATPEMMEEVIGKELTQKILSGEGRKDEDKEYTYLEGLDLKVGGEGMKGFYDKILVDFVNKYGKQWGITVEDIEIETLATVHSIPVTPEMIESALNGQVLFQLSADDLHDIALESETWEAFRAKIEGTEEAAIAESLSEAERETWYKEAYEYFAQPLPTQEADSLTENEANGLFREKLTDTTDEFLQKIYFAITNNFNVTPVDEAEAAAFDAALKLENKIKSEMHPTIINAALTVGRGRDLTERTRKSILTLMRKEEAVSFYRRYYADLMEEAELQNVKEETLGQELPEIVEPERGKAPSIEDRIKIIRGIKDEAIRKKLETGELVVEKDIAQYIEDLEKQKTTLEAEIKEAADQVQKTGEELTTYEKHFRKLTKDLAEKEKNLKDQEGQIQDIIEGKEKIAQKLATTEAKGEETTASLMEALISARQESKLAIQTIKAELEETRKKEVNEAKIEGLEKKEAALEGYKKHIEELDQKKKDAKAIRDHKLRIADFIMNKIPKGVNYEQREQIRAIQKMLDPKFRRAKVKWKNEYIDISTLRDNADFYRDSGLPKNIIERLTKRSLDEWTIGELEELAAKIDDLIYFGIRVREDQIMEWKRDRYLMTAGVIRDIMAAGKYQEAHAAGSEERVEQLKKMDNFGRMVFLSTHNVKRVANQLDGGKDGWNVRELVERERQARRVKLENMDRRIAHVKKEMERLKINEKDLYQYKVKIDGVGPNNATATFTASDLLYVEIGIKNDDTRKAIVFGNLHNQKERASQAEEVLEVQGEEKLAKINEAIANLPIQYRELGAIIAQDFEDEFGRLNDTFILEFNNAMAKVGSYVPMIRQDTSASGEKHEKAQSEELLNVGGISIKRNPDKGFTIERVKINSKNQRAIKLDLYGTWLQAVERQEHFNAYTHYVRDLNAVYKGNSQNSRSLRDAIVNSRGTGTMKYVEERINEIANPSTLDGTQNLDKIVRAMRGGLGGAYLGFKLSGVLKQLITSPMPFLGYVSAFELAKSNFEMVSQFKQFKASIDKSQIMKHRVMNPVIDALRKAKMEPGASKVLSEITEFGMKGLEAADWVSVASGWKAVYNQAIGKIEKALKEDEMREITNMEIKKTDRPKNYVRMGWGKEYLIVATRPGEIAYTAEMIADDVVSECQPSADPADLAPLFKTKGKGGEFARAFTQFQTALNVIYQQWTYDVPNAVKQRQVNHAIRLMGAYILAGALVGLVTRGHDDDDDDWKKKGRDIAFWSMTQFTDSVPMIGNYVTGLAEKAITGEAKPMFQSPLFPFVNELYSGAISITDEKWMKAVEDFGEAIGYGIGAPVSGYKEVRRAFEEGPQALLGRRK